ncbi:MAG: presenilin family intramembrane aspartyl protease [Atribacterota bacterium]
MKFKFKNFNIFWKEVLLFVFTQVLGILVAIRLSKFLKDLKLEPEPVSIVDFLIYFVIITLAVLIFLKISKKGTGLALQIFFVLAVFSGLDILFGAFFGEPIAVVLSACLIILRFIQPTVLIHNLIVIGGLAGIGGMLGLTLLPRDAIILLVILAIYDVIAVYKTKHMVKMAEAMIKKRVILGIIVPGKINQFRASMSDVEKNKIPVQRILKPGKRSQFMILGGGDLALPLLLISSVAGQSIIQAIIVLIFAVFGLLVMHFMFIKLKSKPMPALPPLAIFSILGYLVSSLLI